jgi:energy-converting hydrogenase Eha subunit F
VAGGAYLAFALAFGLAGGVAGKIKGSSFWIWFLISAIVPVLGLVAALLYRTDRLEPRRPCPTCAKECMLHDAVCTRCGTELEFPASTLERSPVVER